MFFSFYNFFTNNIIFLCSDLGFGESVTLTIGLIVSVPSVLKHIFIYGFSDPLFNYYEIFTWTSNYPWHYYPCFSTHYSETSVSPCFRVLQAPNTSVSKNQYEMLPDTGVWGVRWEQTCSHSENCWEILKISWGDWRSYLE